MTFPINRSIHPDSMTTLYNQTDDNDVIHSSEAEIQKKLKLKLNMSVAETCNVHDFVLSASALSSPNLDLSRKGISELPADLPGCEKLECLYLEGNKLSVLPESLFICCPNLRWLDLRNNHLTSLPSSIEKLRSLRTLLLEGNKLISLPPQLGRLRHLTGLNLSNNPLESPPKHVIQKGTKAVLKYLQELSRDVGEEGDQESNSESSTVLTSSRPATTLVHIDNNTSLTARFHPVQPTSDATQPGQIQSKLGLPLPLLTHIPLHSQPQSNRRKHLTAIRENTPSPDNYSTGHPQAHHTRKKRKHQHKSRKEGRIKQRGHTTDMTVRKQPGPPQLSTEEKLEISVTIEKKKAEESLKEWRDDARQLQRQQDIRVRVDGNLTYQKAEDTAPFATDDRENNTERMESSPALIRLKAMEGQRGAISKLHDTSTDSLRDVREAEVKARVNKHLLELATLRKQAGIISSPSEELLEAEKKLAEAIIRRKELEKDRSREYRLTAFTGDLPVDFH